MMIHNSTYQLVIINTSRPFAPISTLRLYSACSAAGKRKREETRRRATSDERRATMKHSLLSEHYELIVSCYLMRARATLPLLLCCDYTFIWNDGMMELLFETINCMCRLSLSSFFFIITMNARPLPLFIFTRALTSSRSSAQPSDVVFSITAQPCPFSSSIVLFPFSSALISLIITPTHFNFFFHSKFYFILLFFY